MFHTFFPSYGEANLLMIDSWPSGGVQRSRWLTSSVRAVATNGQRCPKRSQMRQTLR